MEIPVDVVGKYDMTDPATEELLFDGHELKNGMIVVIEDVELRWDVVDDPDDKNVYYLMMMNRWCQISNVLVRNMKVEFIATYEDGFQIKRTTDVSKSWIVKKESIPPRSREAWEAQLEQGSPDYTSLKRARDLPESAKDSETKDPAAMPQKLKFSDEN